MPDRTRLLSIFSLLLLSACASVGTPTGGPKDLRPPILTGSNPANKAINFKGKDIELTFNEDVILNNPKEEIVISPSPAGNVDYVAKGNRIYIRPHQPWNEDVTYSIQFREGVQDITEKNKPVNLRMAFSTGSYIDSLHINGSVTDLLRGIPLDKITVAITAADTFNIFRHAPSYFTKTDKRGRFSIENLRPGKYFIYAFNDGNKNLKVDSKAESYGFLAKSIDLDHHADSVRLSLIRMDSRKPVLQTVRNNGILTRIRINKSVNSYTLDSPIPLDHSFGDNQSEITFYADLPSNDSIKIRLTSIDSLQQKLDTTFYARKNASRTIPEQFKWSLGKPVLDLETGVLRSIVQTSKLSSRVNPDSLYLRLDSVTRLTFTKEDFNPEPQQKRLVITKTIDKTVLARLPEVLAIHAGKGFLISMEQDTSRQADADVFVQRADKTGTILTQTTSREKNFVLQLLTGEGTIVSSATNATKYTFKNILPAEYQIRIIIDLNGNGKWDPGNYYLRQEPEPVYFYRTQERKTKFPVRANWELGPLQLTF